MAKHVDQMPVDQPATEQISVNNYFEAAASEWGEVYERQGLFEFVHQERLRIILHMVRRLDLPSQARILDVGCGAGVASVGLAKLGYSIDAIDPVRAMVDLTKEKVKRAHLEQQVRANLGDVHALCFPTENFDLVLAIGVLPWLSSIAHPLREMARVLRPGGYLVTTIDNEWSLRWLLEPLTNPVLRPAKEFAKRFLHRQRKTAYANSYLISIRQCDTAIESSGLKKVESLTLGFGPLTIFGWEFLPPSLGLKVHKFLQAAAARRIPVLRSGGSQYVIIAEKLKGLEQAN